MKSLALFALSAVITHSCFAADWSQWRGPSRDGQVESLPASVQSLEKQWSVDLGPSYSGPVLDADRVYTTQTVDEQREVVVAIDRKTGEQIWEASWDGAMKVPFFAASNGSWIRATPALADGRLYVAGMLDLLVCLDAATGDVVWKVDFKELMGTPKPAFGYASSPMVYNGMVITQAGGAVVAVDAATGDLKWKALESDGSMTSGSAFSSPLMLEESPSGPQVLVQTRSTLAGLEPMSGEVLWSTPVEAFRGMNILTPMPRVVGDELQVFTSSYGGGSFMFAIPGGKGDVKTLWTNKKAEGYMSSPVLLGDRIVIHLKNQRAKAIDWKTGETIWTSKPYGKYWSMLTDGESVVALDQVGSLFRLAVDGNELEVLETNELTDSETWAHIAWDGEHIIVRRLNGLDAYSVE